MVKVIRHEWFERKTMKEIMCEELKKRLPGYEIFPSDPHSGEAEVYILKDNKDVGIVVEDARGDVTAEITTPDIRTAMEEALKIYEEISPFYRKGLDKEPTLILKYP
ncbi:hypothetical protein HZA33_03245 [Candidatus Pacearchaeota archaeon]|nr:hypothetical protein [Candidatus Pacearchaeota archaeon]